jgi:hypothetical protein
MDSSKFFNRKINVRDPKTPYQKGKVVEESKNYSSRVFSRVKETSTTKSLLSIRRKVFQIENSLQSIFNLNKKSDKVKQRFAVVELEEERNNKKLSSPATGLGNLIQRPKTGAMDMIKNFVTFTFLGWLFTTLQPLIGKLEWVFPLLKGAFDFIGGTVKFLVESLGSFIKFGYDAKDKFDEIVGNIKKETKGVDKHFDNVLNELKSVFSGAVEVVNSFLDISVDAEELKNARNELNEDSFDVAEIPLPLAPDFSQLTQVSPSIASASNINGGMLDNDQTGNSNENSSSASVTSPTIEAAATGGHIGQQGRIDPKKTPITRGPLQQRRRELPKKKPNIQSQKTAPGKDVGGEDKVKEIYGEKISTFKPDFIPMGVIWGSDEKSGYSALIKSSNEYKKPNADDILGIGNLMGATVDTVLGQKPERRTYTQFADGIRYLVDRGITYPEEFKRIDLEIMLRRIIEPKIEAAIGKIREEIEKKSRTQEPEGGGAGSGFGGDVSGGSSDFWTLVAVAFREDSDPQGQADVAQSIYNRVLALDHGANYRQKEKSIKGIILAPYGYEPTWRYPSGAINGTGNPNPEWLNITDAESAAKAAGVDVGTMKQVAATLLNSSRQESAREFIRGRTDFKAQGQGVTGISRSSRSNVFGWHYNYKKNKIASVPNFGATVRTAPGARGSSAAIGRAAEELRGMSSANAPNTGGGRNACVWAVNQVYKRAGMRPPWGDSNWVPDAERDMIKAGYSLISYSQRRAGDIMIMYDRQSPPQAHIGVVLANGNVLSNSSTNAKFSWEATPEEYNKRYGGLGKIYRMPVRMVPTAQNATSKINDAAREVSSRTIGNFREAQEKIKNMKFGDQPLDFPGVGKVVIKKNQHGTSVKEYYLSDGVTKTDITTFNRILKEKSADSSQAIRRKYGGLVYKNGTSPILPEEKYASYNDPSSQMTIAIQPIIIQTPIPVSSGSKSSITFSLPSVNSNNNAQHLMR